MRRMAAVFLVCVIVLCYDVGIIRVVIVNKFPRPSIHFSEFVQIFTPLSDTEISEMKQSSLEKSYRIEKLEKQQSALQAELKDAKRSLQLANEDLKAVDERGCKASNRNKRRVRGAAAELFRIFPGAPSWTFQSGEIKG